MSVLPIALVGPFAAYGIGTHERYKPTALRPTKSAVLGLVAACLGRDYADDQSDLAALRVHSRSDLTPSVINDYQTVAGTTRANGTRNPDTIIVERELLCDVADLIILEGDPALLSAISHALKNPVFLPYLGLRACVPSRPCYVQEPSDDTPESLLRTLPALSGQGGHVTAYLEDPSGLEIVYDQPTQDGWSRRNQRRIQVTVPAPSA